MKNVWHVSLIQEKIRGAEIGPTALTVVQLYASKILRSQRMASLDMPQIRENLDKYMLLKRSTLVEST